MFQNRTGCTCHGVISQKYYPLALVKTGKTVLAGIPYDIVIGQIGKLAPYNV